MDDVILLNHPQVSFGDFDFINVTFHSCFLAHLDYGWSDHNNIFSRSITYVRNLSPNDKKGERREKAPGPVRHSVMG